MANKRNQFTNKNSSIDAKFFYLSLGVFVIKLFLILNIQGANVNLQNGDSYYVDGIWPGADAENYISAYKSLLRDGIFSSDRLLHYWPSGYPILLLFFSLVSKSWLFTLLSIFQSLIFSFAAYFFVSQLLKTRITNYSFFIFFLILINPTLSLSSIVLGYENLVASGLLIIYSLIIQDILEKNKIVFWRNLIIASALVSVIIFFQPRFILPCTVGTAIWVFYRKPIKIAALFLTFSVLITMISPSFMGYRNKQANNFYAISTNLGVTMNLGAGDGADGAYRPNEKYGVPCSPVQGDAASQDRHLVMCVLNWYVNNPLKSLKLFLNKSIFYWSPWSGPLVSGSMARNPWNKINPLVDIASSNQESNDLVNGNIGKFISWIWIMASLGLLVVGFWKLWQFNQIEKLIATLISSQILINMFISMGTLGDHRQRLPILGLSLFLQAIGIKTVIIRLSNSLTPGINSPKKK